MKLQALHLSNFKRHEDLTINFSETLTVIRGANWRGKSSVLHGIFFAMFGAVAVPCAKERIPRRGQKNCKVTLWFEWNGVDCVSERTLTTATLYVNEELKATSSSAVSQFFQDEILGLSLKDALALAYSPQSQTAALLTLGVPALNRMIESLTQADMIEILIGRAGKVVQHVEASLAVIGSSDEDEPRSQVEAWKSQLQEREAAYRVAEDNQATARAGLKTLESEHTEASKRNELLMNAESDRRQLQATVTQIEELSGELEALGPDNLEELNAKMLQLNASLAAPYNEKLEIERAATEVTRLNEWFDTTGAKWEELEKNIPLLAEVVAKRDALEPLITEAGSISLLASKEHLQRKAERESGICAACERAFENHNHEDAVKAEREAEVTYVTANDAYTRLVEERTRLQREVARLEKIQPPHDYEQQHAAQVERYEFLQKLLEGKDGAALAKTLAEIQQAIENHRVQIATAQATVRQRNQLQLQIGTRKQQQQGLEKALTGAPVGERQDLAPLIAKIQAARTTLHELNVAYQANNTLATEAKAELRAWETTLKAAQDNNAKRVSLEAKAKRFSSLLKWLRESKNAFLGKIWDQLTLVASEIVANATMGYASSLNRTDDGEFMVMEDGEEVPMVSASGGMASICGVALRMALDHVLAQSVGFVVLDEPSSELNDEHAASLAGALRAQERQVILVTHREGEEFVSDTVISL